MTEPIRVLHVITRLVKGGADENTLHTVYGLDSSKFTVDLLYGGESEPTEMIDEERSEIGYFCIPGLCREIAPIDDIKTLWQLVNILRQGQYHIIHTHTAKAGLLGRLAAFIVRVPVIVHTLHGSTFGDFISPIRRRVYIVLEKIGTLLSDRIISVGEDLRDRYLQEGIGRAEDYEIIRSGMALDNFERAGQMSLQEKLEVRQNLEVGPDEVLVGNVSRLEERKGHIYYIEAAKALLQKHHNLCFLIIGDGEFRPVLEEVVRQAGLQERVRFAGFRTDIDRVIGALDILVLTSLWEGLPRVLVQGAAVGKPMVTFSVEGANEVVKEGLNGFVVPTKDVEQLVQRIDQLITDSDIASRMGIAGKGIVGVEWRSETMVRRIENLYIDLMVSKNLL